MRGLHWALVLLVWPIASFAEAPASFPEPGARVRVTVAGADARPQIGNYEALRGGNLVLQVDRITLDVPLQRIRALEVSRGRKPSVRRGIVGTVVGGVVGFFGAGCLANRDDYGVACAGQDDTKFLVGGVVGGLVGGTLSAFIGRKERWESVDLDRLGAPPPR